MTRQRLRPSPRAAQATHRIPVIDKMMDLLGLLERHAQGVTLRQLHAQLDLPRTTVYRLLNSLQLHEMVQRGPDGAYRLGPRLLGLASQVAAGSVARDLERIVQPHLRRLAAETGEACKVSVLEGGELLVVASMPGSRDYALSVVPGQRIPVHVGAAAHILLAFMDKTEREAILSLPLERFTARTLTDPGDLEQELAKVRRQRWSFDQGEHAQSIQAYAAPIVNDAGEVVAALSVPFLTGAEPRHMEAIRVAVIRTAIAIGEDIDPKHGRSKAAECHQPCKDQQAGD